MLEILLDIRPMGIVCLVILGLMSVVSWYVFIVEVIEHSRKMRFFKQGSNALRALVDQYFRKIQPILTTTADNKTRYELLREVALSQLSVIGGGRPGVRLLFGTVAGISPFVGLLGTIEGIMHIMLTMNVKSGAATITGSVGETLFMTGAGLAVAVPAVIFYNMAVYLAAKRRSILKQQLEEMALKMAVDTSSFLVKTNN